MSDQAPTIEELAEASIRRTLEGGQSVTADGISHINADMRSVLAVTQQAIADKATRKGLRPLMRGINLSGVQP